MSCLLTQEPQQQSDYSHIIAAIDLEIEAMNNTAKFASVARHSAISRGYHRIGYHLASLPSEISPQQAASIFFERCEKLLL